MRPLFALTALLLAGIAATAAAAPLPSRTCEQRIEAGDAPLRFPAANAGALFAGPLALSGHFPITLSGLGPRHENGRYSTKVGALVRAGKPVVLSVPLPLRGTLFTHYARARNGESAVRLEPCEPTTPAFSYDGPVGAVTGFSGGFEVTRPGCFPLNVRIVGGRSYRVWIALGRPCR